MRYSLGLLALLMIATSVAEDYESRQFERLLTMPLARWQYIAAQTLVIACLCLLLVLPVLVLVSFVQQLVNLGIVLGGGPVAGVVPARIARLAGHFEPRKNPAGGIFCARDIPVGQVVGPDIIDAGGVGQAVGRQYCQSGDRIHIFGAILYVIPGTNSFAESDVFLCRPSTCWQRWVSSYFALRFTPCLLLAVCLVDFYRKEFNL